MRKINVSVLLSFVVAILLLTSCGGVKNMVKMADQVKYEITPKVLEMHGDSVVMTAKVTFPTKYFQKKAILKFTPVLKYEGGETAFETFSLQGEEAQDNHQVVSYINGGTFSFTGTVAFVEGMRKADLIGRVVASIGDDQAEMPEIKIAVGVMATSLLLEADAKVIVASDKFVRVTNDSKEAAINFVINQASIRGKELKKDEIKELKEFIKEASSTENVEFKGVVISAYASPDGEEKLNTKLADKRMSTSEKYFVKELKKSKVEGLDTDGFVLANATPEDWEGFKTLMQESDIEDKELILRVLSMYSDPIVREKEIKNISAAYEVIAEEILPQLRRSKLTVNISIIGFSDEELKDTVMNADTLKVEEFMYAATLFDDLDSKLAIYKKVASVYTNDWRGSNNVGSILVKQGKVAEAKAAFEQAKAIDASNTIVLNNLGVCAHYEGDLTAAKEYFDAAAGAGNEVSYNQALLSVKEGKYENALNLFVSSKLNTYNFALAKLLNYSLTKNTDTYDASLGILSKMDNQDVANVYYLKAILGARKQDKDLLVNNLKTAIEKDASLKEYAKKDIEFAQYAADAEYTAIVN